MRMKLKDPIRKEAVRYYINKMENSRSCSIILLKAKNLIIQF